MDIIEKFLREHSDGKEYPICSSELAKAFCVPRTTIRRMIKKLYQQAKAFLTKCEKRQSCKPPEQIGQIFHNLWKDGGNC